MYWFTEVLQIIPRALYILDQLYHWATPPKMCLKCCGTSLTPRSCANFRKKVLTASLSVCGDLCLWAAKVSDRSSPRWCPWLISTLSLSGWNICNVYAGQNQQNYDSFSTHCVKYSVLACLIFHPVFNCYRRFSFSSFETVGHGSQWGWGSVFSSPYLPPRHNKQGTTFSLFPLAWECH